MVFKSGCSFSNITWLIAVLYSFPLWSDDTVEYNRDIRPILAKNCFACHGQDNASREAELRLDLRDTAVSSEAIVPGRPQDSELVARIESEDPELRMPPNDSGHSLTKSEIETIRQWISNGANYQQHWAFVPPIKVPPPKVNNAEWPRSPIDHFVLKKLEEKQMVPSPQAERAQLLRRVSLDLIGLPPTMDELEAFLVDKSDDPLGNVVDRLLESEAFGEHWARMWLDLARYADTKGYEKDRHRDIWRYRDWVIDALNADMPYDRFTIEQLAGDLLPNRTTDQILATAFHRNTMTNEEGGTDNEEFRVAAVKDRVDTTIQVWMGLTMGCAKCHSHKYDPISNGDYYAFYAYFNQTQDTDTEGPFWKTPTAAQAKKLADWERRIEDLTARAKKRPSGFPAALEKWKQSLDSPRLWETLDLANSKSENNVDFHQGENGIIVAGGKRPAKDTWTFYFDLPQAPNSTPVTSFRIEHLPQSMGGGDWPDANVAIRELKVELVEIDGTSRELKLANPRATFSQQGWSIEKAIDGKNDVGWALSPKFAEPQVAVFDLVEPVSSGQLKVTLDQQFGQSLLLARSRFSISRHSTSWLQAELSPNLEQVFAVHVFPMTMKAYAELAAAQNEVKKLRSSIPQTPVMLELKEAKRRKTKIHNRGNFLDQTDEVSPAVPSTFGTFPENAPPNRLGVAQWIMHRENPLTSRVMVNRIWARLFGAGLVETEEDFGTQGMEPSHPMMLDWLAVDFRDNGWSIKQLLRTIVMSSTYRQSSRVTDEQIARDSRNRWLGRGPRFRLPAETVRDQALAVSGLLSHQIGGPSVMPPQPPGVWKSTYSGEDWKNADGPNRYRRGLYTYRKRTSPYPAMITFDAGSGEVCQIRRIRTNTPLQALVTLNDTVFIEAAGALAQRMQTAKRILSDQIAYGFRLVLTRSAEPAEIARLVSLYDSLEFDQASSQQWLSAARLATGDPKMVAVANVILNLDETLMKP